MSNGLVFAVWFIDAEYGGGMSNSICSVTVGTEGYIKLVVSFLVC